MQRAIQNSNCEGAASNSDSALRNINRIGMNVNRASTNYVMVAKTSVANISEVDNNLSSAVGKFSAGTTWRLMAESSKKDDNCIKLTLSLLVAQWSHSATILFFHYGVFHTIISIGRR